jgi:hypothetical protein
VRVADHDSSNLDAVGLTLEQRDLVRLDRSDVCLPADGQLDSDGLDLVTTFEGRSEAVVVWPSDENAVSRISEAGY